MLLMRAKFEQLNFTVATNFSEVYVIIEKLKPFQIFETQCLSFFCACQQKLDGPMAQGSHSGDTWNKQVNGPHEAHYPITSTDNQEVKINRLGVNSVFRASGPLVLHHDLQPNSEDAAMRSHLDSNTNNSNTNGTMKELRGSQTAADNAGVSQFSSPSTPSFSPGRYILLFKVILMGSTCNLRHHCLLLIGIKWKQNMILGLIFLDKGLCKWLKSIILAAT